VDVEHQPVVEQDGDCICLVATERPTRFKSLAARLIQPFVGI
jgi:putative transcriptional regulator